MEKESSSLGVPVVVQHLKKRERERDFKRLSFAMVGAGRSKIHRQASRLDTQAGLDAAVLRQNVFL